MNSNQHPWQAEAKELIQNSIEQLSINKREAFLSLDRNVENIIKIYLKLDSKITNAKTSYTERQKAINGNFNDLINATLESARDKITPDDLHHVKWYHDIRNQLYHQGQGLRVEDEVLFKYAELAVQLLESLLGVDLHKELDSQLKKISKKIQNHPDLDETIDAYAVTLKEWIENEDELIRKKIEIADKLLFDFTLPEIKERAQEMVTRYTEDYFAGVHTNNEIMRSKKIKKELIQYTAEIKELIKSTPKLYKVFLPLSENAQTLATIFIGFVLPVVVEVVEPQDWTYDTHKIKIQFVESIFPELASKDDFEEQLSKVNDDLYDFIIEKGQELEDFPKKQSKLKSIQKEFNL